MSQPISRSDLSLAFLCDVNSSFLRVRLHRSETVVGIQVIVAHVQFTPQFGTCKLQGSFGRTASGLVNAVELGNVLRVAESG